MSERERRGDRRKVPSGVLGALALILAVEAAVARHEVDFTAPPRMEWRQSHRAATREARDCAVLGLGTSMTKLGLFPSVLERESGFRAFNLAACAGRLPGSYYLLRRALGAGARPEAIVLEVHPTYLAVPFQEGLVAWPDQLDPAECLDLAWTASDATFFAATTLARALPTLGARAEIRAAILASFRGEAGLSRSNTLSHLRNLATNAGAFVRRREHPYNGEVTPHLEGMYLNPNWSCDRLNERYLRRILDLCSARGIRVYWLIPPLAPTLQARREQLGLDAAYTRFTKRIQRAYPDVIVLDTRRSGYDSPVFWDAAHLDIPGAVTLSAEVGRILRPEPGPSAGKSRWIDLPTYRYRPIEAPLEEFARSARVISESSTLVR